MSDWIVAQEYIESDEDWKIGVLDGELLYACRYVLPTESQKIVASEEGEIPDYASESVPQDQVPEEVIDLAIKAAKAIGNGLYSVDIKQRGGRHFVIEVNDNPSLESGEDEYYPRDLQSNNLQPDGKMNDMSDEWYDKATEVCKQCGGRCCKDAHPPLTDERIQIMIENDVSERQDRVRRLQEVEGQGGQHVRHVRG